MFPERLDAPVELDAHWRDPRLFLSQTCGYPLVTTLLPDVHVVGAFHYTAPGCSGFHYRSELVARIDDCRGNRRVSRTRGGNQFAGLAFGLQCAAWPRCAVRSQRNVLQRSADLRIAPPVTRRSAGWRRRHRGHRLRESRGLSPVRTGTASRATSGVLDRLRARLPLITSAATTPAELDALRRALHAACSDPTASGVREALFIGGFAVAPANAWQVIDDVRQSASDLGLTGNGAAVLASSNG